MRTIIGLPAYNEENSLPKLIDRIMAQNIPNMKLFVVNDGSTDKTADILYDYSRLSDNIYYLSHRENIGLGGAMNTIIRHAAGTYDDDDVLVSFDADNTHDPSIIGYITDLLVSGRLDIVIASRFAEGGEEAGVPLIRKLYSHGAKAFCRVMFHLEGVKDYSCGYRAYRIGFLKKLCQKYDTVIEMPGFECMLELLIKSSQAGAAIREYPLKLDYSLKEGKSKLKAGQTIRGYLAVRKKVKHAK